MLTPEQIAEFNARAAAGEKPRMGWSHCEIFTLSLRFRIKPFVVVDIRVISGEYFLHEPGRDIGPFSSLAAAQLAAEHLLREATMPIHAEAYDALAIVGRLTTADYYAVEDEAYESIKEFCEYMRSYGDADSKPFVERLAAFHELPAVFVAVRPVLEDDCWVSTEWSEHATEAEAREALGEEAGQ
jgi:hypothetical protein